MSPEKRSKSVKNSRNGRSLPFDIYDDSGDYSTRITGYPEDAIFASKSMTRVTSSLNKAATGSEPNKYDEDDEEDFIKLYFASGTVLKPSDEPYDLRSKIHQANRELANDNHSAYDNAPGKVKFDDTVVVLDSFEDIGTVSIGTEKLQGSEAFSDRTDDDGKSVLQVEDEILAAVDLSLRPRDEDDQNDVVVCSTAAAAAAATDGTPRETDTSDDRATTSSASFSRSFSSESADDRPPFINVIESGDEFKTIMDRNHRAREPGPAAIDERVTYFPELFTHAQYKMYENAENEAADGSAAGAVDIYVPKKLDANELRDKLKQVSEGRRNVQPRHRVTANDGRHGRGEKSAAQTVGSSARKKTRPAAANACGEKKTVRNQREQSAGRPRATYYFELDPKGKLRPLNDGGGDKSAGAKFFRVNLKASGNAGPRITKTPNADLFLEFQTADGKAGDRGATLIIRKKKPAAAADAASEGAAAKRSASVGSCSGVERPRLPGYNGLRSEYGLSAEQLLERRKIRMERERQRREFKQRKREEEQRKRAENEKNFYRWLQQKKQLNKQAKTGRHCSYPMTRLTVSSARTSVNSSHCSNRRKGSFALEELLKMKDENSGSWFKF